MFMGVSFLSLHRVVTPWYDVLENQREDEQFNINSKITVIIICKCTVFHYVHLVFSEEVNVIVHMKYKM